MPTDTKGHGNLAVHGHGHKKGQPEPTNRRQGRTPVSSAKQTKSKSKDPAPAKKHDAAKHTDADDRDAAVMHSGDETVYLSYDTDERARADEKKRVEEERQREEREKEEKRKQEEEEERRKQERREYKKSNVTPENFNVKQFNTNMTEFIRTLEDPRYSQIDQDYPVDELKSVVNMVTKSVNDYRAHTTDAQRQLEDLRETMKNIKENLHFSVTRQAMDLRADEEHQTQEERELRARLTQLNAAIAQANADVTEAIRLATETESTAVKANIAAERAREETRRIQEEAVKKEHAEQKRREEEKKRMEEQKRQKEEAERRLLEEQRKMEEEWNRREAIQSGKAGHVYDSWQPVEYEHRNEHGEAEVTCIARGQPGSFDRNHVTCKVASEKEALVTYLPHEELISNVVDLSRDRSGDGEEQELKEPIYVAIPHVLNRTSAQSREAVIKAMIGGEWKDLPTRDVTFDTHKDTKFAQAEVRHLTTLIVMSRFKRDYVTLAPNKSHKMTSSFDQRITLTFDKDTFGKPEHFLLEVQPVDSATIQEFRARQPHGKGLLVSSPIVHTHWESSSLREPVQVTLSCPPNPARAKKIAAARKAKDEKMKNPPKPPPIDEIEKEKERERERKRMQEYMDEENGPVKVTKWYMGEYANTDDDETDKLHFAYMHAGKWYLEPDMKIATPRLDSVAFKLELPVQRFLVVRTRTNVENDMVLSMVIALNEFLGKRFVEAVVRQRSDNPFEVALHVTPVSRLDAVVKQLAQSGFESGPAPSHVICLHEGDMIEVSFSGNIECKDDIPEQLIYKSNIPTVTHFTVKEENKFRQKEHDVYSGLILLTRRVAVGPQRGRRLQGQTQGQEEDPLHSQQQVKEWKREKLCALQISIPKYHIEPSTEPRKAPVNITQATGPVDRDLLMTLAESLGNEWKKVAHYLGVHRARVQAIIRNVTVGERSEQEAKYDMLVTWLKGAAKALDKVSALSSALLHSDRHDLAEVVQERGREFKEMRSGHMTAVN